MITVQQRELLHSETDPIQMWLISDSANRFRGVLASKIAKLQAEYVNESMRWSLSRSSGDRSVAIDDIPSAAKSKLSLATKYQMALDVLNEMSRGDAEMLHVSLEKQHA